MKLPLKTEPYSGSTVTDIVDADGHSIAYASCSCKLAPSVAFQDDDAKAIVDAVNRVPKCAIGQPCERHSGVIHGAEAAELRAGIEKLIEGAIGDDRANVSITALQRVLDEVDARDSLGYDQKKGRRKRGHVVYLHVHKEGPDPFGGVFTDARKAKRGISDDEKRDGWTVAKFVRVECDS